MFNDIDLAQIFSEILPLIHPYQIEFSVPYLYGWHEKNVKGFRYSGHNLSSVFTLKFTSQTASCWHFFSNGSHGSMRINLCDSMRRKIENDKPIDFLHRYGKKLLDFPLEN